MCLAVPGIITSVKDNNAEVDFSGVKRSVSLDLVPDARKNDYVLVHAGFAIQVLEPAEAEETSAAALCPRRGSPASGRRFCFYLSVRWNAFRLRASGFPISRSHTHPKISWTRTCQ